LLHVVCSEDCILNKPVEEWPLCHCLIAFYSAGFPLTKAEAYVRLRRPFCVNDLSNERLLQDRRRFYNVLMRHKIPVPPHVVVTREGPPERHTVVEEFEDHIVVDGKKLSKPFVEKPVDAEVRTLCCRCVLRRVHGVHGV
jgi:inositol hexakisphosphate/diphosphoinositol-pentakisphosphate kinase